MVLSNICIRPIPKGSASASGRLESSAENTSSNLSSTESISGNFSSTAPILDPHFPQISQLDSSFPFRTRPLPRHDNSLQVQCFNQYQDVELQSSGARDKRKGICPWENHVTSESSRQDSHRHPELTLPLPFGSGMLDWLPTLSVEPSSKNAEMFDIHAKILLPRIWSIDALDDPPPDIRDIWVPFTTFSPVILHTNLFRASVWKESMTRARSMVQDHAESITSDSADSLSFKFKSISLLNARLRSNTPEAVDDESITAVAYFFFNEWNWSGRDGIQGVHPHVRGLREMVRLRGGMRALGHGGLVAKLLMMCHYLIAVVLEIEPFVFSADLVQDCFIAAYRILDSKFDSPLFITDGSFNHKFAGRGLHIATTEILDEITFLITGVRSYCFGTMSDLECTNFLLAARSIQDHIASLPSANSKCQPITGDFIYESVRIAALVYCRAIINYLPFSEACYPADLSIMFSTMSRISLSQWKQFPGVWVFILLSMNPAARNVPLGVNLRSLLKISCFSLAVWEWQAFTNLIESFIYVQRWIRAAGKQGCV